jgi:hypothetical protein
MSSVGRGSHSGPRSSEVERIIAAAEVDTTFAGKKAMRYRGRRSVRPLALRMGQEGRKERVTDRRTDGGV